MILLFAAFLAPYGEFSDLVPAKGPHTLVVSDGRAMTRFDYRSGQSCQKARDAIRRQQHPPAGMMTSGPRIEAVCVPR